MLSLLNLRCQVERGQEPPICQILSGIRVPQIECSSPAGSPAMWWRIRVAFPAQRLLNV